MATALEKILEDFEGIQLNEMDAVELMNRRDSKYVFRRDQLGDILKQLQAHYFILDISGHRLISYRNLYYDTEGLDCYRLHHNGKKNRYKVRHRQYVESDISFFEVKFKTNKDRTQKSRIKESHFTSAISDEANSLLHLKSPFTKDDLQEAVNVDFRRMTFVHKNFMDRCTIDIDLRAYSTDKSKLFEGIAIAEIKQERFSRGSPFVQAMEALYVRPLRVSKYCLGILATHPGVKYNSFKTKLRRIDRILNPTYD